MLARDIFLDGFEAIAVRFGKDEFVNNEIIRESYYEIVGKLTVTQFLSAIKQVMLKESYFPPASKILEYAGLDERPPGENSFGALKYDSDYLALPSHEERMSPKEIQEAMDRGRLTAKIILNTASLMTLEQKDELIETLRSKPLHELEAIASTAQAAYEMSRRKKKCKTNLKQWKAVSSVAQNVEDALNFSDTPDSRATSAKLERQEREKKIAEIERNRIAALRYLDQCAEMEAQEIDF